MSIELNNGERIIGDPRMPKLFGWNGSSREVIDIHGSDVVIKNVVIDFAMSQWKSNVQGIGFQSDQPIRNVLIENVRFINSFGSVDASGADSWCINFSSPGGLQNVVVRNCVNEVPEFQLTSGGKHDPSRCVDGLTIEDCYCKGGRKNSIAVTGFRGGQLRNVTIRDNTIEGCQWNGIFVGSDGAPNKPPLDVIRNIRIQRNRIVYADTDDAYPHAIFVKGYAEDSVDQIYVEDCLVDVVAIQGKGDTVHPRMVELAGEVGHPTTQAYVRDVTKVGWDKTIYRLNTYVERD